MTTHAELAAKLLRDGANFFRSVGAQNEPIKPQMEANAQTFDLVANLVEKDPLGELPPAPPEAGGANDGEAGA